MATHREWLFRCQACGFQSSTLWDRERWEKKSSELDESRRIPAIQSLRRQNAHSILQRLTQLRALRGLTLLDIGCGYGWFLEVASEYGIQAEGIEPEENIARAARAAGNRVTVGLFPQDLPPDVLYDLITFNDVLEHIPAPQQVMMASAERLREGGLLVVAIPSSDGVLYRLAYALSQLRCHGTLDRLWQKSFHSPHVSYFNHDTLLRLASECSLEQVQRGRLPTYELRGLWNRLRMDQSQSVMMAVCLWMGLVLLYSLLAILPADIILHVYRKSNITEK